MLCGSCNSLLHFFRDCRDRPEIYTSHKDTEKEYIEPFDTKNQPLTSFHMDRSSDEYNFTTTDSRASTLLLESATQL